MKIENAVGIGYKAALEFVLEDIMKYHGVTREQARKLFAEAIVRNCVLEELYSEINWLLGKEEL